MKHPTFCTVKDIYNYIETNNIENIEIRFLDHYAKIRSFCINAKLLSSKIFTANSFKFTSYRLLPLNIKRSFKDPFLPNPTLIFFTNLVEHNHIIQNLQLQPVSSSFVVSYFTQENTTNLKSYNYCLPPFDNLRTLRDEISLVATKTNIIIKSHFCNKNGCNILTIECKNKLELLDNIEKIKYIILMVASIFNQYINISKGIFSHSSLLSL